MNGELVRKKQGGGGAGEQGREEEVQRTSESASHLSAAMREWKRKLEAGYRIGPRLRMGPHGYLEWGPALFNAEGAFVQNVRRDTTTKLMRLGILVRGAEARDGKEEATGTDTDGDTDTGGGGG